MIIEKGWHINRHLNNWAMFINMLVLTLISIFYNTFETWDFWSLLIHLTDYCHVVISAFFETGWSHFDKWLVLIFIYVLLPGPLYFYHVTQPSYGHYKRGYIIFGKLNQVYRISVNLWLPKLYVGLKVNIVNRHILQTLWQSKSLSCPRCWLTQHQIIRFESVYCVQQDYLRVHD